MGSDRDKESKKKIQEAIRILFHELNMMGNEKLVSSEVVKYIKKEHKTLQQRFFANVMVPVIRFFDQSYKDKFYDARNEATCKMSVKLAEVLEDGFYPFI